MSNVLNTVKISRAWNGKLSRLDELLAWMYDQDILTTTEKARKDRVFRKYYRYYNDGDIPRGLTYSSKEQIRTFLETEINEFLTTTLKKKQGKYSRADFYKSKHNKQIQHLANLAKAMDGHSLFTYFSQEYHVASKTAYEAYDMGPIHLCYSKVEDKINDIVAKLDQSNTEYWNCISSDNTLTYKVKQLEELNAIPDELSKELCFLEHKLNKLADRILADTR